MTWNNSYGKQHIINQAVLERQGLYPNYFWSRSRTRDQQLEAIAMMLLA
ncbi:hypothetical protein [Microseira wollei]|nr:hypothetical protein [Microseira wollei]